MGSPDQPHYVNAVACLETSLEPGALLDVFQEIERAAGRTRGPRRWQARTLDLDLLLFGSLRVESSRLTVPHPGVHERPFVIHPLAEIAPDLVIPGRGRAGELAGKVDSNGLERIAGPPPMAG
jgi:2-amino-4-hydroxy-6-hydroxymethyldihydropteridine diphosphokinase